MQKLYPSSYITRPSERIKEIRVVECFAENACFWSPDIKLLEGQFFHRKYKELFGIKFTKHQPASVLGEGAWVWHRTP